MAFAPAAADNLKSLTVHRLGGRPLSLFLEDPPKVLQACRMLRLRLFGSLAPDLQGPPVHLLRRDQVPSLPFEKGQIVEAESHIRSFGADPAATNGEDVLMD